MWTANIIEKQPFIIFVEFSDGESSFIQSLNISDTTKIEIAQYLTRLNAEVPIEAELKVGSIDVSKEISDIASQKVSSIIDIPLPHNNN